MGSLRPLVLDLLGAVREIANHGFSSEPLAAIGMIVAYLAALSAVVWRMLRLRGGEPGRSVGIIGLTYSSILLLGILGLLSGIVLKNGWEGRMVATAAVAGVVLAGCGGFTWLSRIRLDLAAGVLLVLAGIEMAFWALIGLIVLARLGINAWGLIFVATAVVRGVECVHVLRSRFLADPTV